MSCRKAGGSLFFNMMQRDDEKGPLSAAMGAVYFLTLATGEGMIYPRKDYLSWLKAAGFHDINSHQLREDHFFIIARKI